MSRRGRLLLGVWAAAACYPATTRPAFLPEPTAAVSEVELPIPQATRAIAVALDADSIPVRRTEPRDGWLESDWFDVATMRATTRRPIGLDVVKVRAWVDPSRPSYSNVTVEIVYRAVADPSRPERDLEQQVPVNHPVAGRVIKVLGDLARVYGGVAIDTTKQVKADTASHAKPDSTKPVKPDSMKPVKPDSTKPVKPDSTKPVKPDSTKPVKPDSMLRKKP